MIRFKKDAVEWLEFEQLQEFPEVVHGVFLRPLDFMDPIQKPHQQIVDMFGISKLISGRQVHGAHIEVVPSAEMKECDGFITSSTHVGLLIKHADCQVTIFFDPIQKVIALIHCGWRGSVQNIYANAVKKLKGEFQCKPQNLLVCISPSLGPNKSEFINHATELPISFYEFLVKPNYFNFWEISKMQLQQAGILKHHIEIAGQCTFSEANDFFSYRRDKKTWRNGTVVALNPSKPVSEGKEPIH